MDYFDGLTFPRMGSEPQYRKYVVNSPLYYGIQFNYHGSLKLKLGNGKEFSAKTVLQKLCQIFTSFRVAGS